MFDGEAKIRIASLPSRFEGKFMLPRKSDSGQETGEAVGDYEARDRRLLGLFSRSKPQR